MAQGPGVAQVRREFWDAPQPPVYAAGERQAELEAEFHRLKPLPVNSYSVERFEGDRWVPIGLTIQSDDWGLVIRTVNAITDSFGRAHRASTVR